MIRLRLLTRMSELQQVVAIMGHPGVTHTLNSDKCPKEVLEQYGAWTLQYPGRLTLGVCVKDEIVGFVIFDTEHPDYWKTHIGILPGYRFRTLGYALQEGMSIADVLGASRLRAEIPAFNRNVQSLVKRLGMRMKTISKEPYVREGIPYPKQIWELDMDKGGKKNG